MNDQDLKKIGWIGLAFLVWCFFFNGPPAHAQGLDYEDYEILFTNPKCKEYHYRETVYSGSGKKLKSKPRNVYCKNTQGEKSDEESSGRRKNSPRYRLIEWINDPGTEEIFFAYLSYSNRKVNEALCGAVERDVKVTYVLHDYGSEDPTRVEELNACRSENGNRARYLKRGDLGGITWAHNKIFMVNPGAETMKLAFSSGNLSSGVVLHHENWHFITLPSETYFAQAHLCLMEAQISDRHSSKKSRYQRFIRECRDEIPFEEESDIKVFFVPGEGENKTMQDEDALGYLRYGIENADSIDIAAHRFSYRAMMGALTDRLQGRDPAPIRLVADDDLYWIGQGISGGSNGYNEWEWVLKLWNIHTDRDSFDVRFMQTNHHGAHLLHHNKFLIFNMPRGLKSAVFAGAGNLTGAAFNDNFENFYYIELPRVVKAFRKQYKHLWNKLASEEKDMPTKDVAAY